MSYTKILLVALCGLATVAAHGTSKTLVSKPHQGKFDYDIEHSKHGSWHGSAHPHGYGGLGDGHGSYGLGGAKAIGLAPQGGVSGGWGAEGHGQEHGHGHGHATSSANFNLKAISHGHGQEQGHAQEQGLGQEQGHGQEHGHGHATSSANFNLKAISHGHGWH